MERKRRQRNGGGEQKRKHMEKRCGTRRWDKGWGGKQGWICEKERKRRRGGHSGRVSSSSRHRPHTKWRCERHTSLKTPCQCNFLIFSIDWNNAEDAIKPWCPTGTCLKNGASLVMPICVPSFFYWKIMNNFALNLQIYNQLKNFQCPLYKSQWKWWKWMKMQENELIYNPKTFNFSIQPRGKYSYILE